VQYLVSKGVQTLHTAVLVDRHCAELPVHADVCGLTLQIAPGQVVECRVPPFEPAFQVVLVNPAAPSAARLPGT
jgi:pyrimidine operon attenuation protein/uracil phosphoribosyltransferase